jgi:hypothetical protein
MIDAIGFTLVFAFAGGVAYRLGGSGKGTKYRDLGVPLIFALLLAILGGLVGFWQWISLIPCIGIMWGSLTTYRYFLPKPKNYLWYHYAMHGFFVAASAFPYAIASGHWIGFGIRCVVCAVGLGLWSKTSIDWLEEGGRGFIFVASTPLLLI